MKYKKMILFLSAIIIVIVFLIYPYMKEKRTKLDSIKKKIIRFHIRANSDSEEDQAMKLRIRDEVLKQVGGKFEKSQSIKETRKIILENLETIEEIAKKEIKKEGKNYKVDISLEKDYFPTRSYGNMVFPSGEYEALKLIIGEGKGKNWWCVMFPPLCFVDITHGVSNDVDEEMETIVLEDDSEGEVEDDDEYTIKLKSKIVEVFEKTKDYLANLTME